VEQEQDRAIAGLAVHDLVAVDADTTDLVIHGVDDTEQVPRWDQSDVARGDAYAAQWQRLEAEGVDIHDEAGFVADLAPARVLDAGCGTGRVAIELARRGMDVVGTDLDPAMLATARREAPDLRWVEADLVALDLEERFDVVVTAGNVMIFLAPGTEGSVVARLAAHLVPGGRLVAGFSLAEGGYGLASYDADCAAAGLALEARYATWERAPWVRGGNYAVSVHRAAGPG
jgi:SAM-dependent methyltransferase